MSIFKPGRKKPIFPKNLIGYSEKQWEADEKKAREWLIKHKPKGVVKEAWKELVAELNGQTILLLFNIDTISRFVDESGQNVEMPMPGGGLGFGPRLMNMNRRGHI